MHDEKASVNGDGQRQQKSQKRKKIFKRFQQCCIILLVIIAVLYVIVGLLVAITKPPLKQSYQVTKSNIPIPNMLLEFNYKFNITCQYVYMDNSEGSANDCQSAIQQPSNKNQFGRYQAHLITFDFSNPNVPPLNYSLPDRRFGIKFTIQLDDPSYNVSQDTGMIAYAVDPEFDPYTLPDSTRQIINMIDSNFFNSLNTSNIILVGSFSDTFVAIKRHLFRRPLPNWRSVSWIGVPVKMFDIYFMTSTSESIAAPEFSSNTVNTTNPLYANLFVSNYDWFIDVTFESRSNDLWHLLALSAAFITLLLGIYVCCFGDLRICSFGLCHICCCKKQVKNGLHRRYRAGVPLIEKEDENADIIERINNLEAFMNERIISNDLRTKRRKNIDEKRLLGDPASENSSQVSESPPVTISIPKPADNIQAPVLKTHVEEQRANPLFDLSNIQPSGPFAIGDNTDASINPLTGSGRQPKKTAPSSGPLTPGDTTGASIVPLTDAGKRLQKPGVSDQPSPPSLTPGDTTGASIVPLTDAGKRFKKPGVSDQQSPPSLTPGDITDASIVPLAVVGKRLQKPDASSEPPPSLTAGDTTGASVVPLTDAGKRLQKPSVSDQPSPLTPGDTTGASIVPLAAVGKRLQKPDASNIEEDDSTFYGDAAIAASAEALLKAEEPSIYKSSSKTGSRVSIIETECIDEEGHRVDPSEIEKGEYEVVDVQISEGEIVTGESRPPARFEGGRNSVISDTSTLQGPGSQFGDRRESVWTVHGEVPKEAIKEEIVYYDQDGKRIDPSEVTDEYETISEEVTTETEVN